jgi:ribosomal-protein-alanine N-acetyltransferase
LSVSISAVVPADIAAVAEIEQASFSDPWSEESFRSLLDSPQMLFLVARHPERGVIGYTAGVGVHEDGEILNVAVAPDSRGQGVGALLLDAAIGELRLRSVTRLYLEVRQSNTAAIALYQSRGFREITSRRNYYSRPVENALVLALDMLAE